MKEYLLRRLEDISGSSGTGDVAEIVQFENGMVVLAWMVDCKTLGIYHSLDEVIQIHGHEGRTLVVPKEGGPQPTV